MQSTFELSDLMDRFDKLFERTQEYFRMTQGVIAEQIQLKKEIAEINYQLSKLSLGDL